VVGILYCLRSNDMSVIQVAGAGHVTVLIVEELKVTEENHIYIYIYIYIYVCVCIITKGARGGAFG